MTRRHLMTLRLLLILGDAVAASLVFLLVSVVRFEAGPGAEWSVGIGVRPAALVFAVTWVVVSWLMGLYRLRVRWSVLAEGRDVLRTTAVFVAISLSLLFLTHQDNVSRVFLALLFVVQPIGALAIRGVMRAWFERLRRRGRNMTYMLVVGTGQLAQDFADRVEAHPGVGIRVVGHLSVPTQRRATDRSPSTTPVDAPVVSRRILGTIDQMAEFFRILTIDEVAVCLTPATSHFLEPVIAAAADEGKTVRVPRDPDEAILSGALQEDFDGFLVRSVIHDGQRDLELAVKRVLDVAIGSALLVLFSPVMLVAATVIRMRDGSPVLFRQVRVGRHGRQFTIYKFRTMVTDAEAQLASLAPHNHVRGPAFKLNDDPRTTPLGRVLRRTSVDELPQLLNVIRGDMSLVGPRPALPREVDAYDVWHRRRLSMRPGITGLWQVECRMNDEFDDRAELDLKYIDHWSIWRDLGIIVRTVPAVLSLTGR